MSSGIIEEEPSSQMPRPKTGAVATASALDQPAGLPPRSRSHVRHLIIGVLVVLALAAGGAYYIYSLNYESTDDAFIEGHVIAIASQATGRVQQVLIDDNQHVQAGQILVRIDDEDYKARLAAAQAALTAAQSRLVEADSAIHVLQANAEQAQADIAAAQANQRFAQQDLKRLDAIRQGAASEQELLQARAKADAADATVRAAQAGLVASQAKIINGQAQVQTAQASVAQAQAQVQLAQIALSYTTVIAPEAGRITRKVVEAGQYVQPGVALLAIVPDQVWVVANFKETQLTKMRPGQPVSIRIDAYPSRKWKGHVDSIQSGTGSRFSLLPPENATGNFVKVVQRVPVKIVFDETLPSDWVLAPGMSVEPRVTVAATGDKQQP
ncbi:MAG: HlyD family secretion protein [Phycisphaerales bacterium]|nr:HlyD family secretion protein [Phycisphaerales bacterium]